MGITDGLGLRLEGLEPDAVKVASPVLRGLGVSDDPWLPGHETPGTLVDAEAFEERVVEVDAAAARDRLGQTAGVGEWLEAEVRAGWGYSGWGLGRRSGSGR